MTKCGGNGGGRGGARATWERRVDKRNSSFASHSRHATFLLINHTHFSGIEVMGRREGAEKVFDYGMQNLLQSI